MAKRRVDPKSASAIARRLQAFALDHYGTWENFVIRVGAKRTTAATWRKRKAPSVPDSAMLLQIARATNIDLDWLLMEKGSKDIWVDHDPDSDRQFELAIEGALRTTENVPRNEFDAAFGRLKSSGGSASAILALAINGVRTRFQEELRTVKALATMIPTNYPFLTLDGVSAMPWNYNSASDANDALQFVRLPAKTSSDHMPGRLRPTALAKSTRSKRKPRQ